MKTHFFIVFEVAVLYSLFFFLPSCKQVEQELQVKVETGATGEVGYDFAIMNGKVVDAGSGKITQHGFCYSTTEGPTILDNNTRLGAKAGAGDFSDSIPDLESGTKYYVRAYAIADEENFYGEQTSFSTLSPMSPAVEISSLGSYENDTILITCEVTDDGGSEVSARGVCWGFEENPDLSASFKEAGSGSGVFETYVTGLQADTLYYVRAYATSDAGTGYSTSMSFSTPAVQGSVQVSTTAVSGITTTSAVSGGEIEVSGDFEITSRGVCFGESANPDVNDGDQFTVDGSGSGSFTSSMSGLTPSTTYYVRAYAANASTVYYGEELSFTTTSQAASLPVVTTMSASNVSSTSAESGGEVTDEGSSAVIARGVCWSTSHNPDLSKEFTTDGTGAGSFTSNLSGLDPNTTYYLRAYASNADGTSYGEEESFTTSSGSYPPTVSTAVVSGISTSSATCGGNVSDDGGASVTSRGVCWGTDAMPDTLGQRTKDGTGTGIYSSEITGLSPSTTYYVRAYAVNSEGVSYGTERVFTSSAQAGTPTVTTTEVSSITENSAVGGGNVVDDGGSAVTARGLCWSTSPGPDPDDQLSSEGSGTGSFSSLMEDLSPNTTYYVKAYATNAEGTSLGNEVSFTTSAVAILPSLTSTEAFDITSSRARSGGVITDDGGSVVIARGVCWGADTNPDLSGDHTTDGSGEGSFTSTIVGLDPSSTYYVRAYATNGVGTKYGNEITFTTDAMGETVEDIDGNVYQTVVIGTQTWMSENLKVTHYSNGDPIPQKTDVLDWVGATEGAYCYFDNDYPKYGEIYGGLYNYLAVEDSRNICPSGWHVATYDEWIELVEFAGGQDVAGSKLRDASGEYWSEYSYCTDEFGFKALPAGQRDGYDGDFNWMGGWASFWAFRNPQYSPVYINTGLSPYGCDYLSGRDDDGLSIRCIKD